MTEVSMSKKAQILFRETYKTVQKGSIKVGTVGENND